MVIHDQVLFKSVTRYFFLLAMVIFFIIIGIYRLKKIEFTYNSALKLLIFVALPIISFPFIFYSTMTVSEKIIGLLFVITCVLVQFFGTISFHKIKKKLLSPSDKV